MRFLGYIFECLLDELLTNKSGVSSHSTTTRDDSSQPCEYQPMIAEIKLWEIFKPILHPRNQSPTHPTTRVETFFLGDFSKRGSASSCSTLTRRSNKKSRRKRDSLIPEIKVDSDEKGEKIRKQYVQYKKTLQTCECFHPESLSKRRTDGDDPESFEKRPTSLRLDQLLDVILSVILQFSLYDPYSNSLDSDKSARHLLGFSFKMLAKLSAVDLSGPKCPSQKLILLQRFSDPLIKIVFSGCQKFLKNVTLFKAFTKLNVPEQLFQLADALFNISKHLETSNSANKLLWLVNALENIAIGIALILKALCCDREENAFIRETLPIRDFLSTQWVSILREIFLFSLRTESEKALVITQSFGKLILYMKVLKEDFLHNNKCEKSAHKYCSYSPFISHHFDYYGITGRSPSQDDHLNECLISVLAQLLLNFFRDCHDASISLKILQLLSKCGFCCCMKLSSVLPHLLHGIENRLEKEQNAITLFIETVVWSELSALDCRNEVNCCFCGEEDHHNVCNLNEEIGSSIKRSRYCWIGLLQYSEYIFNPSVGPLITDHIAKLIQASKPEVTYHIIEYIILKSLRVLVNSNYELDGCDSTTLTYITKNLLKCVRLSYSSCPNHSSLCQLMKEKGLSVIEFCKKKNETRFEALHLLCCLVDEETKCAKELFSYVNSETPTLGDFSRYYLTEIDHHETFWMRLFDESSLHVRRKANIKSLPTFQFLRRKKWSNEGEILCEAFEEDNSLLGEHKALTQPDCEAETSLKQSEPDFEEERERETQQIALSNKVT